MTLMHIIPQMDHMHETILIPTCSQGSVIASGLLKCLVGMISLIQLTWYDIDTIGLQKIHSYSCVCIHGCVCCLIFLAPVLVVVYNSDIQ